MGCPQQPEPIAVVHHLPRRDQGRGNGSRPAAEDEIAARFAAFMEALGLDLGDENLTGTPHRVARACREIFSGLTADSPRLTSFPTVGRGGELIAVSGIPFYSVCAHHFLPFFGHAHVGYVPGARLVGLSKLARVIEHIARRPQLQERITEDAAMLLETESGTAGVIVFLEARHLCMEMRGVAKPGAFTTSVAVRGVMERPGLQQQFFQRIGRVATGGGVTCLTPGI